VLTVLTQNQAATSDANAVYLLKGVLPANSFSATGGMFSIECDGIITGQAGGAAQNLSTLGLLIRNSTGGVPDTVFPPFADFSEFFSGAGSNTGLIFSGVGSITLLVGGFFYDPGSGGAGSFDSFIAANYHYGVYAPAPAASLQAGGLGAFPNEDFSITLDFTQEMLIELVLVQDNAGACIPPANFAAWTPLATQLAYST
jgi:hypothetical protein